MRLRTRASLVWFCCLLLCGGWSMEAQAASATVYDLGAGVSVSVQVVNGGAVLTQGEKLIYDGSRSGLSYFTALAADLTGDGRLELLLVESDRSSSPHQAHIRWFGLDAGGLRQLAVHRFAWDNSLLVLPVRLLGGSGQQLLCISRRPEQNGVSTIDHYAVYQAEGGGLRAVREENSETLVHLAVQDQRLLEQHAIFAQADYPSGLDKRWLTWDGSRFVVSQSETVNHYLREEADVAALLARVATEQAIPLPILQAVAWQESNCRQFSYGDYLVSPDGGIGIMQVTPLHGQVEIGYLGVTYDGAELDRLRWDTYFNLQVGAQLLKDKWLLAFGSQPILPRVGIAAPDRLESWYFALWAYNGYSRQNYPQAEWGAAYQEQVIDRLSGWSHAGFGQPSFDLWNGGSALPTGGRVLPLALADANPVEPSIFAPGQELVLTVAANLRSEPAIYPRRVGLLGAGSRLQVTDAEVDGWLPVTVSCDSNGVFTGQSGWVSRSYTTGATGEVQTTSLVNLRKQPLAPPTESQQTVLTTLPVGSWVHIVSGPVFNAYDGHSWYLVRVGDREGYLAAGSMQLADNPIAVSCRLTSVSATQARGESKPGAEVELWADGVPVGQQLVGADGSFCLSIPNHQQPVMVQALATDQRGAQTVWSESLLSQPSAADQPQLITAIGASYYTIAGARHDFDGQTVFRAGDGVTVMALHLFRELGATVTYERGVITLQAGGITARLTTGSDSMQITDGGGTRSLRLRAPVIQRGQRTYIPTRDVSENLGLQVIWNATDGTITLRPN